MTTIQNDSTLVHAPAMPKGVNLALFAGSTHIDYNAFKSVITVLTDAESVKPVLAELVANPDLLLHYCQTVTQEKLLAFKAYQDEKEKLKKAALQVAHGELVKFEGKVTNAMQNHVARVKSDIAPREWSIAFDKDSNQWAIKPRTKAIIARFDEVQGLLNNANVLSSDKAIKRLLQAEVKALQAENEKLRALQAEPVAAEPVAAEPVAAEPVAAEPLPVEPLPVGTGSVSKDRQLDDGTMKIDPSAEIGKDARLAAEDYISQLRTSGLTDGELYALAVVIFEQVTETRAQMAQQA